MFRSLKSKFIILNTILFLLLIQVPLFIIISELKDDFEQTYQKLITIVVDLIENDIEQRMILGRPHQIQETIEKINNIESIYRVNVLDRTGIIKFSNHDSLVSKHINDLPNHRDLKLSDSSEMVQMFDRDIFHSSFIPIKNDPSCHSCHSSANEVLGYVDIDISHIKAKHQFDVGLKHTLYAGLVLIGLLVGILYFLFSIYINRPIQRLTRAMSRVEEDDFGVQLETEHSSEMQVLREKFNHMVSELKKSRERLEEYHLEQLQRADRLVTLGELTSELAHEINNPVGIISTRIDYLKSELGDRPGYKEFEEDLSTVLRQTDKVSRITSSILKYSRRLPKNFQRIELSQILNESLKVLEPRLDKFQIKIKLNIPKKNWYIYGESIQIEQVFTNLLNNAIDASAEEGTIEITFAGRNGIIDVTVSDQGAGIDAAYLDNIFDPFFTTKPVGKGTGLGLYIVKNILTNHDAHIQCESQPGAGTHFRIQFKEATS